MERGVSSRRVPHLSVSRTVGKEIWTGDRLPDEPYCCHCMRAGVAQCSLCLTRHPVSIAEYSQILVSYWEVERAYLVVTMADSCTYIYTWKYMCIPH